MKQKYFFYIFETNNSVDKVNYLLCKSLYKQVTVSR